jgi:hypothetical protein
MKLINWLFATLILIQTLNVYADDGIAYGALRQVSSSDYKNNYTFLMLPSKTDKGKKFNYYDYNRNKILCCISVNQGPFDDKALEKQFDVPFTWINDLTISGGGNAYVDGGYDPVVYLSIVDKTVSVPEGNRMDFDGIIIDERAKIGKEKRTFEIGRKVYRIKRKEWNLSTDAGSLHEYTITDISGEKPIEKPKKIFVPFGVN